MQHAAEQRPPPCPFSPLSCSITSAVSCMLLNPHQDTGKQHCWWQQQQCSGEHHTVPPAECTTREAVGQEGNTADEETASGAVAAAQSACLSVGAWVCMPANVHLEGWDQGSQGQCCPTACVATESGVPVLRVLACTSAGYVPTQVESVTQASSSSGGELGSSCDSNTQEPHSQEQLSSTTLDCSSSSADSTKLFKVDLQLPHHVLATHSARPRLLHLEPWHGRLQLSSSVLLLLPPYLPSTAAELQSLPWANEDREDKALSFVTDLGLWLEDHELMSRGYAMETAQQAQACSEAWHEGNTLLRQAVLWALPALSELLLESLLTLPCAPPSPFAHLAHAHPLKCCSRKSSLSSRHCLSQASPTAKPLLSSKHTTHSASAPASSTDWAGSEGGRETAASPRGPSGMHFTRRSSESASSWGSKTERRDGLLHLALLSPQPINMMMYLLFWGRRWGDLRYMGNKSKGGPVARQKGGGTACLLPVCGGFVWRFDEPNSDGLTPFDILASLPSAPQMLRIMLDEPAEGFSLLKDAARLTQLRSASHEEPPATILTALASASRTRAGFLPSAATASAEGSRPPSPQLQEEFLVFGAGVPEKNEGGAGSDDDHGLPSPPRSYSKSLSHGAQTGSQGVTNVPLLGVQDHSLLPHRPSLPVTQLTSTQVLETFTRAGLVAGSDVVSVVAAHHHMEGQAMQHNAVGCVQV